MIADHDTPSVGSLTLRLSAMTHPGSLPNNEDACQVVRKHGASFVVLADGAGGHGYGEVASQIVVKSIANYLDTLGDAAARPQTLERALEVAQGALRDEITRSPKYYDMRSTGLIVMATRGRIWTGHVGDSRAYLVRNNEVKQITRDDTLVQTLVEIGQLDREAAKKHSKANVLLQCLGEPRDLEYHISEPIDVQVGDVVLACSDGLSDVVPDKDLVSLTRSGSSREIAQRLIDCAVANGAPDNVTVSVIQFRKRDAMPSIAAQRRAAPAPRRKANRQKDSFNTIALVAVLLTVALLVLAIEYRRTHAARTEPLPPSAPAASESTPAQTSPSPRLAVESGASSRENIGAAAPLPAGVPAVPAVGTSVPVTPVAVAPSATAAEPRPESAPVRTLDVGPAVSPVATAEPVGSAGSGTAAPPAQTGQLQLAGLPAGAHVFINDIEQTPLAGGEITIPANHRVHVRIHARGFHDQLESVAVEHGSSVRIRVTLNPLSSPTEDHSPPAPRETAPATPALPDSPAANTASSPPTREPVIALPPIAPAADPPAGPTP